MSSTRLASRPLPAVGTPVVEARGLRKDFAAHGKGSGGRVLQAVQNVSLTLTAGEVCALVGESGSGKSTVARLLCGLEEPSAGSILLDGVAVHLKGSRAFRDHCREVQLVFQDPFSSLNPVHTVGYHLQRPLRTLRRMPKRELAEGVAELLERVNLTPVEEMAAAFPHQLSGGQRQRVAIARALAPRPRVLLADEPISMLDVSIRLDILNLLGTLAAEERLAMLYITHDIASARYFSQRTLVMYAGQVAEEGPSLEVIDRPRHPYTQLLVAAAPDPDRWRPGAFGAVLGSASFAASPTVATQPEQSTDGAGRVVTLAPPTRGEPPSLLNPPSGCRFHPRCPHALAVCSRVVPPRVEVGPEHWSRCWLHVPETDPTRSAAGETKEVH